MKVQGAKSVYGASVGILMLEARFPRIPGDMGNGQTWPFPVQYKVVKQASPDTVVRNGATGLLESFIKAGQELIDQGVDGITTNCGFLALMQDELQQALPVPVATSSLMQVPMVEALLPKGKKAGILTISSSTLTDEHLKAANVPLDTPIQGTDAGKEFTRAILDNEEFLDVELAREDNVRFARELVQKNPDVGAIILECTNMVPYAADIRAATGLPVFSIYSFVTWFQSGLTPRSFNTPFLDGTPIRY
ncbi:MAG: aspartate/glutamate racemase family protein [Sneathiellales bacterium]|nr:aspartate/glutamate racemase family protein [Sneathiellales bacterium]